MPGTAVLLFNGERIVLQRRDNRLTLNAAWKHDALDRQIALPHEMRPLPSPQPAPR